MRARARLAVRTPPLAGTQARAKAASGAFPAIPDIAAGAGAGVVPVRGKV